MNTPLWRTVFFLWLGWYLALITFQQINWARLTAERPDNGYAWVAGMTGGEYDGPAQGAWFYARWDSYRYVAIAQQGYADPGMAVFFPGYPALMRGVDTVLSLFIDETAYDHRMAFAGLIVSAIMSYLGIIGLVVFLRERLNDEAAALRGTFYFMIFPTAMFMPQVYTEATYLACSIWALVYIYREKWLIAAGIAAYATLTRPTGIFLFFPVLTLCLDHWWRGQKVNPLAALTFAAPLLTFYLFNNVYLRSIGVDTIAAQQDFGRYLLHPYAVLALIQQVGWMGLHPNGTVQIGFDLAFTLFASLMCLLAWNKHSGLALYGLAVTWTSLATGQLVSQNRYVLMVLPIFLVLARWGQQWVFDRVWTVISLLLLALYLIQFTQGLWTG